MPDCWYCCESVTYTGPLGNGTESVFLTKHPETGVRGFCSDACRSRWVSIMTHFFDHYKRTLKVAEQELAEQEAADEA